MCSLPFWVLLQISLKVLSMNDSELCLVYLRGERTDIVEVKGFCFFFLFLQISKTVSSSYIEAMCRTGVTLPDETVSRYNNLNLASEINSSQSTLFKTSTVKT